MAFFVLTIVTICSYYYYNRSFTSVHHPTHAGCHGHTFLYLMQFVYIIPTVKTEQSMKDGDHTQIELVSPPCDPMPHPKPLVYLMRNPSMMTWPPKTREYLKNPYMME